MIAASPLPPPAAKASEFPSWRRKLRDACHYGRLEPCKELAWAGQVLDPVDDADGEYSGLASFTFRPRVASIDAALEEEYQHPSDTTEAVKKAQEYHADYVTEHYWKPVLSEIEGGLQ